MKLLMVGLGVAALLGLLLWRPVRLKVEVSLELAGDDKYMKMDLLLPLWRRERCLWRRHTPLDMSHLRESWNAKQSRKRAGAGGQKPELRELWRLLRWLSAKCRLIELRWRSRLGLDDAMYTAIGAGALWAVKGSVLSVMARDGELRAAHLLVLPDYQEAGLHSDFSGIFKIRPVQIIMTGLKGLRIYCRWWLNGYAKRKKRTSHRRIDANGHAEHQGNG